MGLALVLALTLIVLLVGLIAVRGLGAFWPGRLDLVTLRADAPRDLPGNAFIGQPVREEAFDPTSADEARIASLRAAGELLPGAVGPDGRPRRRLYYVANRDAGQEPFRWVAVMDMAAPPLRPTGAAWIDRREWGPWLGVVEALVEDRELPAGTPLETDAPSATRELVTGPRGETHVRERRVMPLDGDSSPGALREAMRAAVARRAEIRRIERTERIPLDARIAAWNEHLADARLRASRGAPPRLAWPAFAAISLAGTAGWAGFALFRNRARHAEPAAPARTRALACAIAGSCLLLWAVLERPWRAGAVAPEDLDALTRAHAREVAALTDAGEAVDLRLSALRAADARFSVIIREPRTGGFAPRDYSTRTDPLPVSAIVRVTHPNRLTLLGRAGAYLDRCIEFLFGAPRNANQEGGVWGVIVGTVTLTLLLTVAVVPLGVIAALYLREYARQNLFTSLVRIAVNNLAGVPSIVYGVFGLGFFCYTLGAWVDSGPRVSAPRGAWWLMVLLLGLVLLVAWSLALAAASRAGASRWARRGALVLLGVCAALALALIAWNPYFHGFFAARAADNQPTFGGRGILWSALTLALLTLPVVIVATEEAIAGVPRSLRESSYGCGASKWQTIRRVVLPGAMPGIMTGAILAISRGAGEVAPIMFVGATKIASKLPMSGEFPFIRLEAQFMHLGFHIYDLGFQAKDAEAARPLVWATTLLLVLIVLSLNLAAVIIRSRLRGRRTGAF